MCALMMLLVSTTGIELTVNCPSVRIGREFMNWMLIHKICLICLIWLLCAVAVMLYDTYLMWFAQSRIEWLQPNHRFKTAVMVFPALGLFYWARAKASSLRGQSPFTESGLSGAVNKCALL